MKQDAEKLKDFIRSNPPLDKEGEPEMWWEQKWKEQLDKHIPNWKEILKKPETWKAIKDLRPRRNYNELLEVILKHAPDKILAEYLMSNDEDERKSAYNVLIEDNAKKLTSDLWNLLDKDTKVWVISKIIDKIRDRRYPRFLEELEILLHAPEHFFKRARRRGYLLGIYPHMIPLAVLESSFYEESDVLHPLWVKLKSVIENANDLTSFRIMQEYEQKFKDRLQRIAEKFKMLSCHLFYKLPSFVSRNVMFDPSLLLDHEKAKKVFSFVREHKKEFNFFISKSFYYLLKGYDKSNRYWIGDFFEVKEPIHPKELYGLIEEHLEYVTLFEIPHELYKEKYHDFYKNLSHELENRDLLNILVEEWVFLQEFSWIVAKSKKVFEKFKEAGAVTIEFSKNAVDEIVRKTLKKEENDLISTCDRLRALGKWVAVGGSAATSFLSPAAAALIVFGTGVFLLLDPEDYSI